MPDYKDGKIYKLVSDKTHLIYIGSTAQPLSKRFYQHKSKKNNCSSQHLFNISESNVEIVLIESFPCKNKEELTAREYHYIRKNKKIAVNCAKCINNPVSDFDEEYKIRKAFKKVIKEINNMYWSDGIIYYYHIITNKSYSHVLVPLLRPIGQ